MNQRIRELALKCAQQLDWDPPADPKEYLFSDKGLNEFAELIVQDCAQQVKDYYLEDQFTCVNAREKILEHFGVAE